MRRERSEVLLRSGLWSMRNEGRLYHVVLRRSHCASAVAKMMAVTLQDVMRLNGLGNCTRCAAQCCGDLLTRNKLCVADCHFSFNFCDVIRCSIQKKHIAV